TRGLAERAFPDCQNWPPNNRRWLMRDQTSTPSGLQPSVRQAPSTHKQSAGISSKRQNRAASAATNPPASHFPHPPSQIPPARPTAASRGLQWWRYLPSFAPLRDRGGAPRQKREAHRTKSRYERPIGHSAKLCTSACPALSASS